MKKLLCIGDSLALPGHLNKYEDTWFYKLKQEFPNYDFISFFKRQLTTDVLVTQGGGEGGVDKWTKGADCLEAYMPDIAIIQLGIVDCAPRLLTLRDRMILKALPEMLGKTYISVIKKIRKRNINNTLVPFEKFKLNLIRYIERAEKLGTKIIFISISLPSQKMINKNKDILLNVERYNRFDRELADKYSFIKVTQPLNASDYDEDIYEDGYHPNQLGHKIIFERITPFLIELN